MKSFASDNNAGVHPAVMKALVEANQGHAIAYGADGYTEKAIGKFKELFGDEIDVYFVFNGTAANILSINTLLKTFQSVICAQTSHINVDECAAPERISGCKTIAIPTANGKLTPELILPYLTGFGFEHHAQPGLISITQVTEMGTVYKPEEVKALADLAHKFNMFLHIDGARIANAVASLCVDVKEFTINAGVDVLSFGGTKNGLMFGEAVVFFNKKLSVDFKYYRKQTMQLYSKMRFLSAQFLAYFENDLWLHNAHNANNMATILAEKLKLLNQIKITQTVDANGVFAIIPKNIIEPLREKYFFYTWDELTNEVRFMCSFDTTEQDVEGFVNELQLLLQ